MKGVFWKELREGLRVGVLALLVLGGLLFGESVAYRGVLKLVALGQISAPHDSLQPLAGSTLRVQTVFFCAIFAAVLGWLQVFPEQWRGLWSFLRHRPMSSSGLFAAKVMAGLCLYSLVVALPFLCFTAWVWAPGNVAAPFEGRLLLPLVVFGLGGIPWYFAGMLTGLRQARWYVSRGLGLGAGLICSAAALSAPSFWQALLVIGAGGLILALAAWGSFHTNGWYRGQPAAAKPALALSLALGWVVVAFVVGALAADLVSRLQAPASWSYYVMLQDGTLCRVNQSEAAPANIMDTNGLPVKDPETGAPLLFSELDRQTCHSAQAGADFQRSTGTWPWHHRSGYSYSLWQATPQTLWFYSWGHGRLIAYDVATRRLIGSLGPQGFARDLKGAGDRFHRALGRTLMTETGLFLPDLHTRSIKQIFAADPDDPIGGAVDVVRDPHPWQATLVLTRRFIRLLSPAGGEMLKAPYEPGYPDYYQVTLCLLEPAGRFALWLHPSPEAQVKSGGKLPALIRWYDGSRQTAAFDAPALARPYEFLGRDEKIISIFMAPSVLAAAPWFLGQGGRWSCWQPLVGISLLFSIAVCLPVGWWMTRRYALPRWRQLSWAAFLTAFGLPGLLALLCAEEWPARERCATCGKWRVVDRELCEHCGAPFPPPQPKGIEIMETPAPSSAR